MSTAPPDGYKMIGSSTATNIIGMHSNWALFIHDGWSSSSTTSLARTYFAAPWCYRLCVAAIGDKNFPLFAAIEMASGDTDAQAAFASADRLGALRSLVDQLLVASAEAAERLGADDATICDALMPRQT